MNNLLERAAEAIKNAPKERRVVVEHMQQIGDSAPVVLHQRIEFEVTNESRASAAISAICDEIDEGGFTKALDCWWITKSTTNADNAECLGDAIRAYLKHLKSTTETKESV